MSLLGIDIGTRGCKAAVFSEDGQLLGLAYEEYDYQHSRPGWAELDTAQVWLKIKRTIGRAAAGVTGDPPQVLCVSSLGETVVPVSADRKILGLLLLNFDSRGAEYLGGLQNLIRDEQWYHINGIMPGNQYSLTAFKNPPQAPALLVRGDRRVSRKGFSPPLGETKIDSVLILCRMTTCPTTRPPNPL